MGFTPEYRARVEELLGGLLPIRTKAMFGGVGIYSGDLFFALIAEDQVYLKADKVNQPMFDAAGLEAFYPFDSPTPMRYFQLPAQCWDDAAELKLWVDSALGAAERAKRKK